MNIYAWIKRKFSNPNEPIVEFWDIIEQMNMNNQSCKNCRYFTRRHLNLADPWGICDWPNEKIPRQSIPQFRYSWETTETYGQNCPSYQRKTDLAKRSDLQVSGM